MEDQDFWRILRVVADHFHVDADMLVEPPHSGHYRSPRLHKPRRVAMLLIRETGASLHEIGRFFSRDHTTIIYALRTAAREKSISDIAAIRAVLLGLPGEGCHQCLQLMVDLAALKLEILEMRARIGGCG